MRFESLEQRQLLTVLPLWPTQGGTPDYYGGVPNWANSPQPTVNMTTGAITGGIQKFADSLAGLYFASPTGNTTTNAFNRLAASNNLQQCIPIAVPDVATYLGSDYYEIALVQYAEKMSSSLNATTLRGYVQVETTANFAYSEHIRLTYPDNTPANPNDNPPILDTHGIQVYALAPPEYLGPSIVAAKDRPVRVKFSNYLPTGTGGDLFLPVDTTSMGAGMGPNMIMPMPMSMTYSAATGATVDIMTMAPHNLTVGQSVIMDGFTPSAYNGEYRVQAVSADKMHFTVTLKTDPGSNPTVWGNVAEAYTDNRATLHLHGGNDVWISDGTQNQWITPSGENTHYPAGVSVQNVPDMPDPGLGSETFFYSNQQSARLMFYHDHALGITRLNVYAGEAAGYLLTDAVEQDLITRGILPDVGTPLIIQDKTFVDTTLVNVNGTQVPEVLTTDPTWPFAVDTAKSDLWAGHVYMPNQNPNSLDGTNPMGRWDYGPFFWPPWPTTNKPLTNPTGLTITNGGSGYLSAPLVTITPAPGDTTGSGAKATATITNGIVTAITLVTPGTAYTADPIVTVAPPPTGGVAAAVTINTLLVPNVPDLSMTMESFMDTPLVNGTVYPYMDVQPKAYRFRVLNAANDRMWNLQLYTASTIVAAIKVTTGGSGYTTPPLVTITPATGDTTGMGATATATIDPVTGAVTAITLVTVGSEYTAAPTVTITPPPTGGTQATATATIYTGSTEVGMVPATPGAAAFPAGWTTQTVGQPGNILDNRFGGVPDPRNIGPSIVQIGTEGGFLPTPVIWPNTPIGFERNPKNIVVGNVAEHNLFLGPAERADIIIDFSQFKGKTVILYNDGPAAVPAPDSRLDYFTGDMSQTATGGSISTLPGYGPNTRTIMCFRVSATGVPTPFNLAALQAEFTTTTDPVTGAVKPGVFVRDQDPIIVPQAAYNSAYGTTSFPADTTAYSRIQNMSLTFKPLDLSTPALADQVATSVTIPFQPKAIAELFENNYGRMQATLGVEVKFTNGGNQTTIPYMVIDPVTEILTDTPNPLATQIGSLADGTQIWKITHNGVDTHPIHFHLFNVQVINRVGWDGAIRVPDANELGWKETVRMNPLEDIIVALRPTSAKVPFGVPDSIHLLDPTMPQGSTVGFSGTSPNGTPIAVTNQVYNFGWEYVWHCHMLSHEEMDMMRPMQFNVARALATASVLSYTSTVSTINLSWTDPTLVSNPATWGNPANEIGYRIERADIDANGNPGIYLPIGLALANATSFTDTTMNLASAYSYQVIAYNAAGETKSNALLTPPLQYVAAPTSLTASLLVGPQVRLTWTDNALNETGFVVQRSTNSGAFVTIATPAALVGTGTVAYLDTTAQPGTTYAYRVYAVNGAIGSAFSNTVTVIIPVAPAAPTNLTGTAQTGPQVSLTFRDNATNETGFIVERSVNGGAFATLTTLLPNIGTGNVTYVDTTVTAGISYAYRVKAVNGVVSSAFSNTVTVNVPLPPAPAAPSTLSASLPTTGSTPQVALTFWDNATNETGFVVERAVNGGAFASLVTLPARTGTGIVSYTDTTVAAGTTYAYRVKAMNGTVSSAYSNTVTVLVSGAPSAPSTLSASLQATAGTAPKISLTFWDNATFETGFVVERAVNGGAFAALVTLPSSTGTGIVGYTDNTVAAGTTYAYRVKAMNGTVSSAYSNTVTVTVPVAPAAPSNLKATAVATNANRATVNLSWTVNSTNQTGFVIQRSTTSAFTTGTTTTTINIPANATKYADTGLARRATYYYRILSQNAYGDSIWVNLTPAFIVTP